jgi:lipopolysaccharide export system protein LptA
LSKRWLLLLLVLAAGLWSWPAWGAPAAVAEAASEEPIDITAERLEVDEPGGTAVFTGQVVVTRGEMTVYAEKLILYREPDAQQIERIEASGGVRVVQLDRVGTAQQASFYQQEEKLVLSGDARIQQGQNLVSGEEIVVFLKENRSLVKSGEDGRVRAVFFPEQEQK